MNGWLLLGAVAAGWAAGVLANWAGDALPMRKSAGTADGPTPPAGRCRLRHRCTLWWRPWGCSACPHCGQPMGWRQPLVEAGMIVLYALIAARFGADLIAVAVFWLYTWFLLVVAVIDLEHRRVLNDMLVPAAVVALAVSFLPPAPTPLAALIGGAAGFGLFLVVGLIGRGAMGAGDVKLAGVIGLMTGFPGVLTALVAGVLLGGLAALLLLITRRAGRKTKIAYAPYLALGAWIALWIGFTAHA